MSLGRYQLGKTIHLWLRTRNAAGTPSEPTDVPGVKIYNSAGTIVYNDYLPVSDPALYLFHLPLFLGSSFAAGQYSVVYLFNVSTYNGIETDYFEIVAGGHADGAVTAMHYFKKPHAAYLVQSLQSGNIAKGKSPSL